MFAIRQYFLLFLTATIWGSGFVGQKIGMSHISPFAFTFIRTLIGALSLLLFLKTVETVLKKKITRPSNRHKLILGSIACGLCLFVSEILQQYGIAQTDVNKTSFITSLYMVFVPIIGIFLGQKLSCKIIIAVAISVTGLYFFSIKDGFYLSNGDFLVLLCAVGFAVHILVIAYFIKSVDGVLLSCGQFFVASFLGFLFMFTETMPTASSLMGALPALLYVGIMSNAIAYTLQIVGQRGVNPTIASLILSLESVMGAFFGMLILQESLSAREILGAVLMFTAFVITQINISFKKKNSIKQSD